MNRKQTDYLRMADATLLILNKNVSAWSGSAPFASNVAVVQEARQKLTDLIAAQQVKTIGVTEDKEDLAEAAVSLAVQLSRQVQALALEEGNATLFRQMQVNGSILERMADGELHGALVGIYERLKELPQAAVAPYGVTEAALQSLDGAISDFKEAIGSPRKTISERKTHTETLNEELRKMRQAFAKLDRLAPMFRQADPGFVSDYENARILVETGSRAAKPEQPGV